VPTALMRNTSYPATTVLHEIRRFRGFLGSMAPGDLPVDVSPQLTFISYGLPGKAMPNGSITGAS